MSGFDYNIQKSKEVVELAKLYKQVKGKITIKDVNHLIKVVYEKKDDYLDTFAKIMASNSLKKEKTSEKKSK